MRGLLNPFNKAFFINIVFIIAIFLPVNASSYLIQGVIMFGLILSSSIVSRERMAGDLKYQKVFLFTWVFLSFCYNVIIGTEFNLDSVIKLGYLTILILFFPISSVFKLFKSTIFICITLIFISQISFPLQISFVTDLIDTYYAREFYFNSSETIMLNSFSGSLLDLRFGGIYRNPNQCARIITLLYAVFLVNKNYTRLNKFDVFSFLLFVPSILMTGSRTSLFIFILLSIVYCYKYLKRNFKKIIFILPISIILTIIFIKNIDLDARIFDYSELSGDGTNSSFTKKIDFLLNYVQYTSFDQPLNLFFGTFNVGHGENYVFNLSSKIHNFDSEVGYLFYSLGIVGVFLVIWFYKIIYTNTGTNVKFLMIILLWSLTSTILTNMRFSFLFLFILSLYYDKKKRINV